MGTSLTGCYLIFEVFRGMRWVKGEVLYGISNVSGYAFGILFTHLLIRHLKSFFSVSCSGFCWFKRHWMNEINALLSHEDKLFASYTYCEL